LLSVLLQQNNIVSFLFFMKVPSTRGDFYYTFAP